GTEEFRFARTLLPGQRNDTVFAYLSGQFLNQLISPHYQIEMMRRARSAAEIDMAMVARLAGKAEGHQDISIESLIRDGYLPTGFGVRPDGSRLEASADGAFVDSLRGARGAF